MPARSLRAWYIPIEEMICGHIGKHPYLAIQEGDIQVHSLRKAPLTRPDCGNDGDRRPHSSTQISERHSRPDGPTSDLASHTHAPGQGLNDEVHARSTYIGSILSERAQ